MGDYESALADANKVIELKAEWPKGYVRKGAALQGMGKREEALAVYEEGISAVGEGAAGPIVAAKEALESAPPPGGNPLASLFGPDIWTKIAMNPSTRDYMGDPEFVNMINAVQADPSGTAINQYMQDPRFQAVFMMLLGAGMPGGESPFGAAAPGEGGAPPTSEEMEARKKKAAAEKAKREEEERAAAEAAAAAAELTEEEKAKAEIVERANAVKAEGNALYKKRDFEGALAKYQEAKSIAPEVVTYVLNEAAVYLEMKDFDRCLEACDEAMALAKSNMDGFETYAKVYVRKGNCYMKMKDFDAAVKSYESAQREVRSAPTLKLLNKAKRLRKEAAAAAYFDVEKSDAAKTLGDDAYRSSDYPTAVKHYEEAIKRNPENPKLYSNKALALMKLGALPSALKDCEKAIELDPVFVRAYLRRGQIEFLLRDYHLCLDSFEKVLELDPTNTQAPVEMAKVQNAIRQRELNPTETPEEQEAARARAMSDPKVQAIYSDPNVQAALQAMAQDPAAANELMQDPVTASKILRLRAAGVIRFG